jgi:amino acid transporter
MTDRRRIGLPSLIALVVANSVGIGVFTSSGFGLAVLPPDWLLLAWLVGGLVAACGALSYAGLAEALPESGGEYLYLHRLAHPLLGFLAGWISLTAGFTAAIAASALGLSLYAAPLLGFEIDARVLGTAAILLATAAHAAHLEAGLRVQNVIVVLKLALLAAFLAIGARHLPDLTAASPASAAASPDLPAADLLGFGSQLVWIFFAYAGWNATVYLAGEVRDPSRNARRSLLIGTAVVVLLYLALNAVFVYSAPRTELAGDPAIATRAARILGGPLLEQAMAGTILLALLSSVSAMLLAGPRVYARMADDGVFPRFFAFDRHVPARAIWLQAALAILVVWLQTLSDILSTAGFLIWFSSAASVGLLFVLARRGHRPTRIGHPWIPALFILSSLAAGVSFAMREGDRLLVAAGVLGVGAMLGTWVRSGRSEAC